ncbi:CLUMA_CG012534, isoform A [Clunio marinus]|uniref:CLUMA_CG012534, isoform A n=1 Tax=Clunio marinus TaxID=568069 RepID=A0A1J1IL22_9DIPT|nr:CLUMA_CG012534, isoform A [Clunio marinus]
MKNNVKLSSVEDRHDKHIETLKHTPSHVKAFCDVKEYFRRSFIIWVRKICLKSNETIRIALNCELLAYCQEEKDILNIELLLLFNGESFQPRYLIKGLDCSMKDIKFHGSPTLTIFIH